MSKDEVFDELKQYDSETNRWRRSRFRRAYVPYWMRDRFEHFESAGMVIMTNAKGNKPRKSILNRFLYLFYTFFSTKKIIYIFFFEKFECRKLCDKKKFHIFASNIPISYQKLLLEFEVLFFEKTPDFVLNVPALPAGVPGSVDQIDNNQVEFRIRKEFPEVFIWEDINIETCNTKR